MKVLLSSPQVNGNLGGSRGDCETVYGMKPLIWSGYKSSSYSGGLSFICIGIEMTAVINMLITKTTPAEM